MALAIINHFNQSCLAYASLAMPTIIWLNLRISQAWLSPSEYRTTWLVWPIAYY